MSTKRSKRLNWTGRITIDKSCVDVTREAVAEDQPESVTIVLDLSDYTFPKSASVVLEASHRFTSTRYDFGTIGKMVPSFKIEFSEFLSQNLPTFRLMVVDKELIPGRILGSAERIKVSSTERSEESRNIFRVDSRDIGEEVWRVEFDLDDYPKLVVNRKIPNLLFQLEHNQTIQSLILPVAFRTVLTELAKNLRDTINDMGDDNWVSVWLKFCTELCDVEDPRHFCDDEDRLNNWIDQCITTFSVHHSFATNLRSVWEGKTDE